MQKATPPPGRRELRRFGVVLGLLVAVICGVGWPCWHHRSWPLWPWIVAGVLWAAALVAPGALRWLHTGWMKLGAVLGWINTRLLLGVFFFIVVTPVGLLKRLTGYDPLRRRFDPHVTSYREPATRRDPTHLKRPF